MEPRSNNNESANGDRIKAKYDTALKKTEGAYELAKEELSASEDRYRTLFDESIDGIIISTPDGKIQDANSACADMLGYSSKDLLELGFVDDLYMRPDDRDTFERTVMRHGFVKNYEVEFRHRDGSPVVVSMSANVVRDTNGKTEYIQGIVRDMTAHRLLESHLLEAQKMESVGRLAGGVAHDFNNFLTAIQGNIDLARMKLPVDSEVFGELEEARASSKRAANLARQLLLFSRREPVEMKPTSLNKVVDNLMKMLERLIGESYRIKTELADGLWDVNADQGHMEQVIMNLVINARDAMLEGGTVILRTRNVRGDKRFVKGTTGTIKRKFVELSVTDSGAGMSAETQSRIFEPFFTTKGDTGGTGLGLSVVYGIITRHGGWLDIDSVQGRGSSFMMSLPVINGTAGSGKVAETSMDLTRGGGQRILLVEDEAAVREMAEKTLVENGFEVVSAVDGESALDSYDREEGRFDIVFSDVVLPKKNGIWLVEQLRGRRQDLPVLLASGYTDLPVHQAINKQGYPVLQKPYDIFEVIQVISSLVQNRQSEETC